MKIEGELAADMQDTTFHDRMESCFETVQICGKVTRGKCNKGNGNNAVRLTYS
jgi:hypothetical protein